MPVKCDICDRSFARGEHLRRHRRTHTKEKPYGCACGRSFARRDLLTRHERLHHSVQAPHTRAASSSAGVTSVQALQPTAPSLASTPTIPNATNHLSYSESGHFSNTYDAATTLYGLSHQPYGPISAGGGDVGQFNEAMHGLSGFLDTVGLDFDLDFNLMPPVDLTHPTSASLPTASDAARVASGTPGGVGPLYIGPEPQDAAGGRASTRRRIPDASSGDDDFHELKPLSQPWKVTEDERRQFLQFLSPFTAQLGRFSLPSRLSIARYVAGLLDNFAHHQPFIHLPTFRITNYEASPELILGLLAMGAQYRYEYDRALALYRAGRSIVLHRMATGQLSRPNANSANTSPVNSGPENTNANAPSSDYGLIQNLGAILLLATFSSWQRDQSLVRESQEYHSLLTRLARDCGLSESESDDGDNWLVWSRKETARRTKLCVFSFLNLQSLALNLPPALLSSEINLRLPSSGKEWLAVDQSTWLNERAHAVRLKNFQDALASLLVDAEDKPVDIASPFGDYLLMQALIQRMMLARQFALGGPNPGHLPDCEKFERALQKWRDAWHMAPESVLDLRNSKDSISWSATSFLGLAHVRVHFELGEHRQLRSGDPQIVAAAVHAAPLPSRGSHLLHALLHSAHALNIPAQLGVAYLSKCQALFWSIQHSLCFFECAVFLSKWVQVVAKECPVQHVDRNERQVLKWVLGIVTEVQGSLGVDPEESGLPSTSDMEAEVPLPLSLSRLSVVVVEIFAHMFENSNAAWGITHLVGESLRKYADLLEEELSSH